MTNRRQLLQSVPAFAMTLAAGGTIAQTSYPLRLIKIVVGNAAGGTDDALSRFVADRLTKEFGQPVIVENRGGGATTIGGAHVANSAADGYTLLCITQAGINQTILREKLSYRMSSFVPIAGLGGFPLALAVSGVSKPNITNLQELTAAAQSGDGITFGSGGVGTMAHLASTRLLAAIKGRGVHVSYKNNPDGLQALMGGFCQMFIASASEVSALRGDGRLRVLAVASSQRTANLPDVPTFAELGVPDFEASIYHTFVAPVGTPTEIVQKLADAISRAGKDPELLNRYKPLAYQDDVKTGKSLESYLNSESARWKAVIAANNIKVE